jgi:hypothetical protein
MSVKGSDDGILQLVVLSFWTVTYIFDGRIY